ncbi:NAD(P)-dependent oxidoreductase [Halomicronema hongdechloris C2206]|uniref:NAD(P)-dependent oxidoreductase n=1 Tax=Halomicronema hongdechloris C2206 TaxID=1641165 RepID=A0A1Z3HHW8_9CYAN|nr:NAD(P)-dependent oxidoreductase [Halomicronema hongdechloris]ASC69909.1 NAD(P)-dependent oxidoreductase [Halomicronema hongdechloris C2206]
MRVFVAGATGAIGRPLVAQLMQAGYDVFGMTRSQERAQAVGDQGATPIVLNIFEAEAVDQILKRLRPDVVIEELTSLPQTYTRQAMQAAAATDARTRQQGGRYLQNAAAAAGVRRYIIQSCGFWYAPGDGLASEETPLAFVGPPAIATGTRLYANLEQRVLAADTLEGIALRYGFFYGPGTWYAPDGNMAQQVRQQQFPIVGDGAGVWSWIHVDDAAAATVAAVERGAPGIYTIVDDTPMALRDWLPAYAHWLGAPPPLSVSAEAVQDADTVYYATRLRGAANVKAKQALAWQPRSLAWLTPRSMATTKK